MRNNDNDTVGVSAGRRWARKALAKDGNTSSTRKITQATCLCSDSERCRRQREEAGGISRLLVGTRAGRLVGGGLLILLEAVDFSLELYVCFLSSINRPLHLKLPLEPACVNTWK